MQPICTFRIHILRAVRWGSDLHGRLLATQKMVRYGTFTHILRIHVLLYGIHYCGLKTVNPFLFIVSAL